MSTLAYFASGEYKDIYQEFDYDNILLVDHGFRKYSRIGKVICYDYSALRAIDEFKRKNIKIDCLVIINEGLFEGGGRYALNSDMFLGYLMPILNDEYYHYIYPKYYAFHEYKTDLDLPFLKTELNSTHPAYINPLIFSEHLNNINDIKLYKMKKNRTEIEIELNKNIKIQVINDSIWCDFNSLDLIFMSIKDQGQGDFFDKVRRTYKINRNTEMREILEKCNVDKINRIGIMPWKFGDYQNAVYEIQNWDGNYPKTINFYHLNQNDFEIIKKSNNVVNEDEMNSFII
jgi:hypothetical protein